MKKGIVYGCLMGEGEPQMRFEIAAKAGFEGVEIGGTQDPKKSEETLAEFKRMKEAADAAGITLPSIMASTHWSHPLSSPDDATRDHTVQSIAFDIENAHRVGADTVLVVPAVVNEEVSYEQAYERSQAELKKLAAIAEKKGVTIAIENVWNKFLLSPIEFRRYIEEIGSPSVKAYFDCGNILVYGFPDQWIRTLGTYLHRVHVKDFRLSDRNFVYLLQGDVPWKDVMVALREVGYDSYITAELGPYPQCPEQMVFDTSNALSRIFEM